MYTDLGQRRDVPTLSGYCDTDKLGVFHPAVDWKPVPPRQTMYFLPATGPLSEADLDELFRPTGRPIPFKEIPSP